MMIKKILTGLFMATIAGLYAMLVAVLTETGQGLLGIEPFRILVVLGGVFIGWALTELYIKINGF